MFPNLLFPVIQWTRLQSAKKFINCSYPPASDRGKLTTHRLLEQRKITRTTAYLLYILSPYLTTIKTKFFFFSNSFSITFSQYKYFARKSKKFSYILIIDSPKNHYSKTHFPKKTLLNGCQTRAKTLCNFNTGAWKQFIKRAIVMYMHVLPNNTSTK